MTTPQFSRSQSRRLLIFLFLLLTSMQVLLPAALFAETGGSQITQLLSLPIPQNLEFCGEQVPLTREDVLERLDHELVVILGSPIITTSWFKRSPRYFPLIEKLITEKGLPQDLKYVALIESNLRADAVSSAGATGPWQFMACTGDSCGLDRSNWRDERRDWQEASNAALNHLASLRQTMGSWAGALAAYNAGPTKINNAKTAQIEKDFYGLRLPRETERYVFRAIAAKLVMENPAQYGIRLEGARLYGPETIVEVSVNTGRRGISVAGLAEAAGVSYRRFLELNPVIVGKDLPVGIHRIRLPREAVPILEAAVAKMANLNSSNTPPSPAAPAPEATTPKPFDSLYVVLPGDTLNSIAKKHSLKLETLLGLNNITPKSVIKPGQKLLVQPASKEP